MGTREHYQVVEIVRNKIITKHDGNSVKARHANEKEKERKVVDLLEVFGHLSRCSCSVTFDKK